MLEDQIQAITDTIQRDKTLAHYLSRRADAAGEARGRIMRERGVIIASGFMAGGALGGVLGASLRLFSWYREDLVKSPFFDHDPISQLVSAALFIGVCAYLWWDSTRKVE